MRGEPRPEAVAAAEWWAARLGRTGHVIGTRTSAERCASAAATAAAELAGNRYSGIQRDRFAAALAAAIEQHLIRWETGVHAGAWRPGNPQWASANRAIGCGYGPDQLFFDAAEDVGVPLGRLDLPMQTVMWINPGYVAVAEGHGAAGVTIWRAPVPAPRRGQASRNG